MLLPVEYKTVIKRHPSLEKCLKCSVCHQNCIASLYSGVYDLKNIFLFDVFTRGAIENQNLWNCPLCDYCYERCPYDVKTIEVLEALKEEAFRKGLAPTSIMDQVRQTLSTGFGFPITAYTQTLREKLGIPSLKPEKSEELEKIAEKTGLSGSLKESKSKGK